MSKNYWGYRIDTSKITFFRKELERGILRQGWGWNEKQDLRSLTMNAGAKRNLPIYKKVKKGDILLIPRCPSWREVGIARATEDFNKGYQFSIDSELKDYGHCFPAELIRSFDRNNQYVSGEIRATLKNPSRFWNLNHCGKNIEELLTKSDTELLSNISRAKRFENAVNDSFSSVFNNTLFADKLYEAANTQFSHEEWEFALIEGLRSIFPEPIFVERTGGTSEKEHGTDILITIPGILGSRYLIAIQVKDYSGIVGKSPIAQISKADAYWNNETDKVIDKYLIITKSKKEGNDYIQEKAGDVKIIFADELKELLSTIGKAYIGINESKD